MQRCRALGRVVSASILTYALTMMPPSSRLRAAEPALTVADGKYVSLEYTLKLDDQSIVETNVGAEPLSYMHGSGQIIPGLEKALTGLAVGATTYVTVAPADAYGETDANALQEVQKQLIPPDALKVGTRLQGQAPNGRPVFPRVAEIKEETVVLDFNHPLAGKTLHFDVKVLTIQNEPPPQVPSAQSDQPAQPDQPVQSK